ncbi:MAG: D-alanine--D-alanine ligase [Clostridia bacterium]|nr:D-alanine--D-alanine ligase [Clostridia bacterium]
MNKVTVLCLFGGVSEEHEVSLTSARSVLSVIDRDKYAIVAVGITKEGRWLLYEGDVDHLTKEEWQLYATKEVFLQPSVSGAVLKVAEDAGLSLSFDAVFPIMHGKNAEDGTLQGLLSLYGVKYVGCDCLSSAVCMDKATTKMILKNHGIPQAAAMAVEKRDIEAMPERLTAASEVLGYPVFVKPSASGSSCGVSRVNTPAELLPALHKALKSDRRVLIEEYIRGAEVEVAILGNEELFVATPGEIAPNSEFYDYETKYYTDTATYHIPARISATATAKVQSYAKKIYRALGCRGLARVDFFVDGERVVFNEINTMPGFTSISMYPKMMEASGISYPELIDRLVTLALS